MQTNNGGFNLSATGDEPIQAPQDGLAPRVLRWFEAAHAYRAKKSGAWKKNYEYYFGRQWDLSQRPRWKASPVRNYVYSKVETIVPIMTDNRPTINTLPVGPEASEYADTVQRWVNQQWLLNDMDTKVAIASKACLFFNRGVYHVCWDHDKRRVQVEVIDTLNFFVDPRATSVDDARYVIRLAYLTKGEILRKFGRLPGKASPQNDTVARQQSYKDNVEADAQGGGAAITAGYEYAWTDGTGTEQSGGMTSYVKAALDDTANDDTLFQVLECYYRSDETERVPAIDPQTGPLEQEDGSPILIERLRYPNGKVCVVVSNEVLSDEPLPYDHGWFPFVAQSCNDIQGEFWGPTFIEFLISPQMNINKTLGQIIDNKNLMGAAPWLIDRNSGIEIDDLVGEPGSVIEKNPGTTAERLEIPVMPQYIVNLLEMDRQSIDDISGVFDVTQGRSPSGITAGVAIEQLQEASNTRIRLLVRNLETAIRRLGEHIIGLGRQYVTEIQSVRVTDPVSGAFSFVTLTPEMLTHEWEISIASGSTLPRSRDARQRDAVELGKLGWLDPQGGLELIDLPGKEKILQRLQQQQQLAMQAAAQAGPQPSQMAPAGPVKNP